ncbi:patatin-like phospholipase family protein [Nocardioidaceae bacterium]|nr:patatin-like phospholipase family protein [Nocardioidaceae bacterium]
MTIAYVLGGGGVLGAVEVGMLRALTERGVRPDLVLGTSVGALNGAVIAKDPGPETIDRLVDMWSTAGAADVYASGPVRQVVRAARTRTHLHSAEPLRRRLREELGSRDFADLVVPFQCVASCIERSAEHWFSSGPLVPAILASAAVPGLFPPAEVDGEHFLDGGIVNSVPVGRAVELGATTVYVMQVGRLERPLTPPSQPWEVARVSFEIARRHRFVRETSAVPEGVSVHVLPTGETSRADDRLLAFRDFSAVRRRIDAAYEATRAHLDGTGGVAS